MKIIAFCEFCKKFHEYQDFEAHDKGINIPLGASIWEPLVIPIEAPDHAIVGNEDKWLKYTVARLNKILEEAKE